MKIIIFKFVKGFYLGKELAGNNTSLLIEFFSSDVGFLKGSFLRFINDPTHQETIRNYCCIIKDGDDVLIGCQFDKNPYGNCIRMPQKEFVSMLNQWDKLMDQDPQEIIVYKEGESYRLEGRGFPDKQE